MSPTVHAVCTTDTTKSSCEFGDNASSLFCHGAGQDRLWGLRFRDRGSKTELERDIPRTSWLPFVTCATDRLGRACRARVRTNRRNPNIQHWDMAERVHQVPEKSDKVARAI